MYDRSSRITHCKGGIPAELKALFKVNCINAQARPNLTPSPEKTDDNPIVLRRTSHLGNKQLFYYLDTLS